MQRQESLEEADYLDPFQSGSRPDFGIEMTLVACIREDKREFELA